MGWGCRVLNWKTVKPQIICPGQITELQVARAPRWGRTCHIFWNVNESPFFPLPPSDSIEKLWIIEVHFKEKHCANYSSREKKEKKKASTLLFWFFLPPALNLKTPCLFCSTAQDRVMTAHAYWGRLCLLVFAFLSCWFTALSPLRQNMSANWFDLARLYLRAVWTQCSPESGVLKTYIQNQGFAPN